MSPRAYAERVRGKLLDLWDCQDAYGPPVGCVASTYTFDAPFYEEECLGRFVGMETNAREDGKAYVIEREDRLSQVFALVLVDKTHVPRQRSLRWHVLPVPVPGGGIQHAKVSVLVWRKRIRVLVGSANLTEPGYRRNLEHVAVIDFDSEGDLPLSLLEDALRFVRELAQKSPAALRSRDRGPAQGLDEFLQIARGIFRNWPRAQWRRGAPRTVFVPVFPGRPNLFEQLSDIWGASGRPSTASILSPFYDVGRQMRDVVDRLVNETMAGKGTSKTLEFRAPGRREPGRPAEIDLPVTLKTPWCGGRTHRFRLVPESGQREGQKEMRNLHAKSLWLEQHDRALYVVGSSNFTARGTGIAGGRSNIEANLAYVLPSVRSPLAKQCLESWPPSERVDPNREDLQFLKEARTQTAGDDGTAPLPEGFGLALYRPDGEGGVLSLDLPRDPPKGFEIRADEEGTFLDEARWRKRGRPSLVEQPWKHRRPPSFLVVSWREKTQKREAVWSVNVTDPASLPPPEELRDLDLEQLIEILSSARPLHEALGLARRRGERKVGEHPGGPEIDPHKKVDTSRFLLRRMRRVSRALEGLHERLERSASSLDGLRWRLEGPVGPLALAIRLAEEEAQGAAFMITEVALVVQKADWSRNEKELGRNTVRAEVRRTLRKLKAMARSQEAPPALRRYVKETLKGIGP